MITHACVKMTLHDQETTWRQVSLPLYLPLEDLAAIVAICFGMPEDHNYRLIGQSPRLQYLSDMREDILEHKNATIVEFFSIGDFFGKSHTAIFQHDHFEQVQIDLFLDTTVPILLPEPEVRLKQWSGDNPPSCAPWQEDTVKKTLQEWFDPLPEEDWDDDPDAFLEYLIDTMVQDLMEDPSQDLSEQEAYEKVNQIFAQAGEALARNYSLRDCLDTLRKDEMLEIARANRFHGYSKLRRQELLEFLEQNLLDLDSVQWQLASLTQPEIVRLIDLCQANVPFIGPETLRHASSALQYGLCYIDTLEDVLTVPLELRPMIKDALKDPELTQEILINDIAYAYCYAAVYLFGAYPVKKLLQHLQPEVSLQLDEYILPFLVNHVARSHDEFVFQDGYIVEIDLSRPENASNLAALKKRHAALKTDYWPDRNTIIDLEHARWLIDKDLYRTFLEQFAPFLKVSDSDIAHTMRTMEYIIRTGSSFSSLLSFLTNQFFELPDMQTANLFVRDLQQIWNQTPMWLNGGLSPDAMRSTAKSSRKAGNVLSFAAHSKKESKKKSKKKK